MADLTQIIDNTAKASQSFYQQFFKAVDSTRHILPELLQPTTAIIWNGTPIAGGGEFITMCEQLPDTNHEVTSFNCHPLPSSDPTTTNMTIQTSGKVKFGQERGKNLHGFSATFFVQQNPQQPTQLQCTSLSYRLVFKPDDSTVQM